MWNYRNSAHRFKVLESLEEACELTRESCPDWSYLASLWQALEADLAPLETMIDRHNILVYAKGKPSIYPIWLRVELHCVRSFANDLLRALQRVLVGEQPILDLQKWIVFTCTELRWFKMVHKLRLSRPVDGDFGPHALVHWTSAKMRLAGIMTLLDTIHESASIQLGE